MDDDYIKITVAHEFFHAVQFGYDEGFAYTYQGINWAEATAVWAEDVVYNSVDDYVYYLPDFYDYPDYSIFASIVPSGTYFEYALNIWPKFLSEYYSVNTIRYVWEEYFESSEDFDSDFKVYEAVSDIVDNRYHDDLEDVYKDFTLWNLDMDMYEEGEEYPELLIIETEQDEYVLIDEYYAPALYGANYLYFDNDGNDDIFYFHVVKTDGVSYYLTLVPYDNGSADLSKAESVLIGQDEDLDYYMELDGLSGDDAVIAVVSPLEGDFSGDGDGYTFDEGYLYYYLGEFGEEPEEDVSSGSDVEVEESGEKEGEEVGDEVRVYEGLSLSILEYDEDSVTFSWNRLSDNDIVGYELWYGTDSETYDSVKEIDRAYTTFSSVTGLTEGQDYYFQLFAVDEDGDQVDNESTEIVVTPEGWLFTDLSYLDEYYDAVTALVDEGIFEGYPDGSFQADGDINRAELLKILIEGQELNPNEAVYKDCFPDVGTDWYAKYVCYAADQGWVGGYPDGYFRPGNTVNKVEALKILFNVYEAGYVEGAVVAELPYPDVALDAWYSIFVWYAANLGILSEDSGSNFNAENGRTRGEMSQELYRYLVVLGLLNE